MWNVCGINLETLKWRQDMNAADARLAIQHETGLEYRLSDIKKSETQGYFNTTFVTPDYVFKFPNRDFRIRDAYRNSLVMRDLQDKVENIPNLLHLGRHYAMTMETRLPAKSLKELYPSLSQIPPEDTAIIGHAYGKYMGQCQKALSVADVRKRYGHHGSSRLANDTGPVDTFLARHDFISQSIVPPQEERRAALDAMLVTMQNDLDSGNVLYDPDRQSVYFVDFGNLMIARPAVAAFDNGLDRVTRIEGGERPFYPHIIKGYEAETGHKLDHVLVKEPSAEYQQPRYELGRQEEWREVLEQFYRHGGSMFDDFYARHLTANKIHPDDRPFPSMEKPEQPPSFRARQHMTGSLLRYRHML